MRVELIRPGALIALRSGEELSAPGVDFQEGDRARVVEVGGNVARLWFPDYEEEADVPLAVVGELFEEAQQCSHENVSEGVDEDGRLAEPPFDVCVDCGARID